MEMRCILRRVRYLIHLQLTRRRCNLKTAGFADKRKNSALRDGKSMSEN